MGVPRQVEEAGKKADDLHKELYPDQPKAEETEDEIKKKAEGEKTLEKGKEAEPQETPAEPTPVEPKAEDSEFDKLQHKFKVLQGKYDAEVTDVKRANDYLTGQLVETKAENQRLAQLYAELSQKVDGLDSSKKGAGDQPKQAGAPMDYAGRLTQEQLDKLDNEGITPEILNYIGQMIDPVIAERSKATVNEISNDLNTLKQDRIKQAERNFWVSLDRAVPDWRDINAMEQWHAFLGARIIGTNTNRQALLDEAQGRYDDERVAEIFNEFKDMNNIPRAQTTTPPQNTNTPPAPKKDLKKAVDPIMPSAGVTPQATGRSFTKAEIKKFYSDQAKGTYKNNPQVADALEKEILEASLAGRITA